MMPTIDEALAYLGYDYKDAVVTATVTRALNAAVGYFYGAVGSKEDVEKYLPDDPRVPELVLHYLDEIYDEKGVTSSKANSATRNSINSLKLQLQLALRQAKDKEASST